MDSACLHCHHNIHTMMSNPQNLQPKPRKDCKYSAVELQQILPFKTAFITARTVPERILILKTQILPAMFNYWNATGKQLQNQEESQLWAKVKISSYLSGGVA